MSTVIRLRGAGLDAKGGPTGTPTRVELCDIIIEPRTSSDVDGTGRDGIVEGLRLYHLDADLDVVSTDRLEIDGDLYVIDGAVGRFRSPFSEKSLFQCDVKRGTG